MAAPPAATPPPPARLSRLQEKEELRGLNDRLALYIERVRALELENDRLLLRVSEKEEVVTREVSGLKALYEAELGDTRQALDQTARERAELQIEAGKLRAELEELGRSCKKKDGDWSTSQGRIRELEGLFHRSEAELTATLSEKQGLEAELAETRARLAKSEEAHAVAKRQLEQETLLRVDVENRCQSLREELDFRKSLFEEEVRETQKLHQRHLVEVDSSCARVWESRAGQSLEDLRRQHDQQVQLYKQEVEQTYQAKLDSARLCSERNERAARAAREELDEARLRIEALRYQLSGLQKQASTAEERMRDLEELRAGEQEKLRGALAAKGREAAELRDRTQQQLLEYQELLDVKLALDMEISAYRKLLEGEEERLKLSPSPPPHTTASRASSSGPPGPRSGRSKRKRAEEAEGLPGQASSGSSLQVSQRARGSVRIEGVDPQGRFVQLKNHSDQDQPLGSWRLKRVGEGGEEVAYKFTPKYVLRAGQTVTIWAAEAGVAHSPPSVLVWKSQGSWGAGGDPLLTCLVNSDGEGAFGQCYKFTDTCSHRVYAVKVISQQRVARLGNQGKVQREIELHSQLHHRNVVGFHRHFADQENIYLVLEYCSRKSLADILKVRRRLTEAEVRFYLKQITSGLQYLHQQGVIHRDLKLSNVFITERMQVKIGDLGLAMREEAQPSGRRGGVCGTPNYLAPEVIAKKGHSSRSDVWALGCIMYTTLAGFPPFEATPKQELFQRIREGCYLLPAHLSPAARSLIGGLLSPDPSGRPSLQDMLGHPFFAQHPTLARLPSRTCRAAPVFPLANPLGKFFQKAARLFLRGSPGRDPQAGECSWKEKGRGEGSQFSFPSPSTFAGNIED